MKSFFINKKTLASILAGTHTPYELREFVQTCYNLALPLIRKKIVLGKINLAVIGLKEADVVYDCIADLFKGNDDGVLIDLSNYFSSRSIEADSLSDEYLITHLRKLVNQAVYDGIFRLYNEADPALGKIIRNIKIAADKSEEFEIKEFCGEQYLVLSSTDVLPHLTTISDDELHTEIEMILVRQNDMPDILKELAAFLCEQETYQRKVKLVALAIAVKRGFEMSAGMSSVRNNEADYYMITEDARFMIQETCRELETRMKPGYVLKGKVVEATFMSYMNALEQVLCDEFVSGQNGQFTLYEQLKQFIPDLTQSNYMKHHRIIFEYLAKLAKERTREKLKKAGI